MSSSSRSRTKTMMTPLLLPVPHNEALRAWHRRFTREATAFLRATPRLTLSGWAERYRRWKEGTAQEAGRYRVDRTPYLREPMDSLTDPTVERIVIWKPARSGFTEGFI